MINADKIVLTGKKWDDKLYYRHSGYVGGITSITAKDLLKMVTINAATCFNKKNELGSISEGKFADLFLINLNDPNFYSYNVKPETILPLIVNRTKSENVIKTYIKGELVFER